MKSHVVRAVVARQLGERGGSHCESIDNRHRECALQGRGPVRLVEQISRSDCREGCSRGADRDGFRVSRGCRGVFGRD